MRIVSFPASIAVLLLAALLFHANFIQFCGSAVSSQMESSNSKESNLNQEVSVEDEQSSPWNNTVPVRPWMGAEQAEQFLLREGGPDKVPVECCPSVVEMSAPDGGVTVEDTYVKLYKDGEKRQQFFEISCRPDVLNQPCLFMERRMHNRSRCVQKHTYSYAIVLPPETSDYDSTHHQAKQFTPIFPNETNRYVLEYIKIRSGCSCEVRSDKPLHYRKKSKKKKKTT